jgi:recombination protein RecA
MALPAHLASRFSPALARALHVGTTPEQGREGATGFGFGIEALDAILPDQGLPRGGIVELSLAEGAPGTSLALALFRCLQARRQQAGQTVPWSAFVDPSGTLYAPGVAAAGVRLDRLLVVRPPLEALSRTAIRLSRSKAFELVVIDTLGVPGASHEVGLRAWPRLVRRLALEVDDSSRTIVLLTSANAARPLPLPVAQRIEITRPALDRLVVRVVKDRQGRIMPPRVVPWARERAGAQVLEVRHAQTG